VKRGWHHGHSLGAGVAGGMLIASHVWLVLVLGICIGVLLAYVRQTAAWFGQLAAMHVAKRTGRKSRSASAPVPVYGRRSEWAGPTDEIPF
jgi:hypothetical protein